MRVNLEQLREAMNDFGWNHNEASVPSLETLDRVGDLVFNAPRVWWCEESKKVYRGLPTHCKNDPFHDAACHWVALVPITGEEK